mgnify:FL=1
MKISRLSETDETLFSGHHVRPELSFVVPAFNEESNIAETIRRIDQEARKLVGSFEIIIVDDGSSDQTFQKSKDAGADMPLRLLRLSRNFGKEQAIMAGLEASKGMAVVILDADLQEPLCHLRVMLQHRADGYDVVYAVRAHRNDETVLKRLLTRIFYKLLNLGSDADIPADARDFRLMDRKVVQELCNLPEKNRFMKGLYGWVGFRSIAVPIELAPRGAGKSSFGLGGLLKHGLTGMTSFTSWPLRIWTLIGLGIAALSIIYGLWIVVKTMIFGVDVPGWSTLAVAVLFLGGIQLISIGVLGEYLARVFTEVKGRPGFIVAETHPLMQVQR